MRKSSTAELLVADPADRSADAGPAAIAKLHALCDPATITIRGVAGGAVTAAVEIGGYPCLVYVTQPDRSGGALEPAGGRLIADLVDEAALLGQPVLGVWHSGGASLQAGAAALDGMARVFRAISRASGRTLQLSIIDGPAAGGAAYAPALTDVVIMTDSSYAFVTGPRVVAQVTGEQMHSSELGGPAVFAGCIDASASDKAARFVQFCDSFGLPMIVLVDVPGYLPGTREESGGILRRGAKLLHAFSTVRIPSATVIVRKAFGGAYIAMNSSGLGSHLTLAWPGAELGVMNAETAVSIIHRDRVANTPAAGRDRQARLLADQYHRENVCVDTAVEAGLVDRVVSPARTRPELAAFLATARGAASSAPNPPR